MTVAIRPGDRVRDVIARDARLIDVFVAHSAHFEKLRNPVLRRVVAGVVTVEQAAGITGVSAGALVAALNAALGIAAAAPPAMPERPSAHSAPRHPAGRVVMELDVRDDLRDGREPFARIMSTIRTLEDHVLRVRAPFEPVPLVGVLAQRGLSCESEEHAPGDWSLWAWRGAPEPVVDVAPAPATDEGPADRAADEMWLDVRGLEPPEPMARTLVALETLPPDVTLVQVNVRVPQFLLPVLDERGFAYEIDESPERVLVRIRRAS